ncbi:MAG: hypothetical protein LBP91_02350 [Coriobacteriales bacterium]|nr:hypothetical protein [Coriobacteriales bacterium]
MTGIGIVHGPLRCDITITGGTVFAQGKDGPGIGNWATPTGSTITITGGTVVAQSESNAGIGGAASSEPAFNLGPEAHVRAYSGGATPAINTLDNTGSGYFVNARFNAVLSSSAAATLYVCSQGSPGTVLKTLSLPANYKNFAYSSQTEVAQTDNLFAQSVSAGLVPVVRAADNSPAIYSIKARAGYNSHNSNANNGLLPVQPGSDTYYTITEKYVDTFGSPLAGQSDAMTLIVSGGSYSKAIPAIPDFIVKGSKWDTSPDNSGADYTRGSLVSTTVSGSRDLYLVYAPYLVTDVTVSKTVCGDFADRAYAFAFTVYFADDERTALPAGTTISYTGGVIPGSGATLPQADLLTLDAEGKTSITLAHGQTVTFIDLLSENWIRVEETVNDNYYTSFWDSADASDTSDNDTDYRCIGTVARTFDFENVRSTVEDMGVLAGRRLASLLLAAALALIVPAHQVVKGLMREKRNYE